jgi:hypothetical protein
MLLSYSYAWTRRQLWLITGTVVAGLIGFGALVYRYERYYRGPDDSFFVGTWRGKFECLGDNRWDYRFKSDHSYERGDMTGNGEEWYREGKWFAGGEFIYLIQKTGLLNISYFDPGPYDHLEVWHIDSMTSKKVRIHHEDLHGTLIRAE